LYSKCGGIGDIQTTEITKMQPNQFTYTILLSACANLADLSLGKKIQSEIDELGVEWNMKVEGLFYINTIEISKNIGSKQILVWI
jgi:hypothetical protein